jgi:2-methylisocitrate lyase-like PEP mutase family enzyme
MMLGHIAEIVASVDLPLNADFESGNAHKLRNSIGLPVP